MSSVLPTELVFSILREGFDSYPQVWGELRARGYTAAVLDAELVDVLSRLLRAGRVEIVHQAGLTLIRPLPLLDALARAAAYRTRPVLPPSRPGTPERRTSTR